MLHLFLDLDQVFYMFDFFFLILSMTCNVDIVSAIPFGQGN